MGWGNILAEESEDLKRKFEEAFKGDEEKLHEYWPQAFRWTCWLRVRWASGVITTEGGARRVPVISARSVFLIWITCC